MLLTRRGLIKLAAPALIIPTVPKAALGMQLPILARRGPNKPFGSIPHINFKHPLAADLVFYGYDTGAGVVIDLVGGASGVFENFGTVQGVSTSQFGSGTNYQNNGQNCLLASPDITSPIVVNLMSTTAVFSAACGFNPTVAVPNTGGLGPELLFGHNMALANNWAINSFYLSSTTVGDYQYAVGATSVGGATAFTSPAINIGAYNCIVGVSSSPAGAQSIYMNGSLAGTTSQATNVLGPRAGSQINIHGWGSGGTVNDPMTGFTYWGGIWAKALSPADALQLYLDPYCLLTYPEDEMFATLVGSSGPPPPSGQTRRSLMGVGN